MLAGDPDLLFLDEPITAWMSKHDVVLGTGARLQAVGQTDLCSASTYWLDEADALASRIVDQQRL